MINIESGRRGIEPWLVKIVQHIKPPDSGLDPSLVSYARHLDQEIAESEDGAEGPAAFRERRKPVWKMR